MTAENTTIASESLSVKITGKTYEAKKIHTRTNHNDTARSRPHCFINSIRFKTVIRINKGTNVQKWYIAELHKK